LFSPKTIDVVGIGFIFSSSLSSSTSPFLTSSLLSSLLLLLLLFLTTFVDEVVDADDADVREASRRKNPDDGSSN
jgi:hypothetical protein